MITLRTLGSVGLTAADGRELDGLLRQPKRLALLIYLASPEPGTWHRRETIMALFWPSFETSQARVALRNALYVIRLEVGSHVIRSRGDDEVSIDPAALCSDGGAMRAAIASHDDARVLAQYGGDFLTGFYATDADEFDRWVDDERRRLRDAARDAAVQASRHAESAGDLAGAIDAQRRAVNLEPADESQTRRLMVLHDRTSDRGQALAVYDRLCERLRTDFETEPAAETVRLADEIRARPNAAPAPRPQEVLVSPTVPAEMPATNTVDAPTPVAAVWWHRLWWLGAIAATFVVTVIVRPSIRPESTAGGPRTMVVLPMENATGDAGNDYIASGLAEGVAQRLAALGTATIRSAARTNWPAQIRDSLRLVTASFGTTVVLRMRLTRAGDSLEAGAELVNPRSGDVTMVGTRRFVPLTLHDAGSALAAAIAGTVYRVPLPEVPRPEVHDVDPEAFRLTLAGWHALLGAKDDETARDFFVRATDIDRLDARAWSGLSSTWASATVSGMVPFEDGVMRAEQAARRALAIDSLQGTALANLGVLEALKARDLSVGEPYFRRAIAVEPANPEIFMVYGAALRYAGQWDRARDQIRIARQLDPLSAYYVGREANDGLCENKPEDALHLFRVQVELDSRDREGLLGVAVSLARLHRWDEAIAALGVFARSRGDTTLLHLAEHARGESGYWAAKHQEGLALLARRNAVASQRWIAPYLLGVAEIGAGHIDRGLDLLEGEVRSGNRMVYKLRCNPEIDEVRSMPRFQRLLEVAGSLPLTAAPGNRVAP